MSQEFFPNDVVVDADGAKFRVLKMESSNTLLPGGHAWLIGLESRTAVPHFVSMAQLEDRYLRLAPTSLDMGPMRTADRAPSAASIRRAETAYLRIEPLLNSPGIFEPSPRHALLLAREADGVGTAKTLLNDLRKWWQGGQTFDALLGKFANCGNPRKHETGGRGRKRTIVYDEARDEFRTPYQLTEQDLKLMREVIEAYYFDKVKKRTLRATLEHLHQTHYTYVDGNGVVCLRPEFECPTYKQLRYFLKKNYTLEKILTSRKGEKRFAQEDRSTQGSIQRECLGPGHMYEFDATIVDVYLVSSADRRYIVGKPTLYLIIDRFSRAIVGFYIGFENASYTPAMQAILSLGEDKEALCRKYGQPYDPADWLAHGVVPMMFLADQGEMTSRKARRIARALESTISNVPGMRPDWKPLVECGFKMLHQLIAPETPAYMPDADARKRRAERREGEAAMNIHEFTSVILAAIIAHNKRMQVGYPLSIEQAADGVRPIPRELWAHGIRTRSGYLARADFEKIRHELLPRDKGTITQDGVVFEKLHYTCPEAEKLGWLVTGRKERKPLEIAHDFRLVDEILLFAPDGSGQCFVAHLTKDSTQFAGRSLKEVRAHFADVRAVTAGAEEVRRNAMFEFRNNTKDIINASKAETKAVTVGVSRSGRRKDTASARQVELKEEQLASGGVRPQLQAPPAPAEPKAPKATVVPLRQPPASAAAPAATQAAPTTMQDRLAEARRKMLGV